MENSRRNVFLSILFILFIIALAVGGYIYTNQLKNDKKDKTENKKENLVENKDPRIDKNKDYIYFENEELVSEEPEITLKDVIINFEGAEVINSSLKAEMDEMRNSIVKLDDNNKDETKTLLYSESDIYSAKERMYTTYNSGNIISLVINDLEYNCYNDFSTKSLKSYIFDIKNNVLLKNEEVLNNYKITTEDINDRISLRLEELSKNNDAEILKDETLSEYQNNYALYIDGLDLYMTYIVKTNFVDYNDSIKIN